MGFRASKCGASGNAARVAKVVVALTMALGMLDAIPLVTTGGVQKAYGEETLQRHVSSPTTSPIVVKTAGTDTLGGHAGIAYASVLDHARTLKGFRAIKSSGADECRYALVEMSGDEIPELVVQGKFTGGGYKALVYTYDRSRDKAKRVRGSLSYEDSLRQGEGGYGASRFGYGLVVPQYGEYRFVTVEGRRLKSVYTSPNQPLRPLTMYEIKDRSQLRVLGNTVY